MVMRKLPNVEAVQFDGSSQEKVFSEFIEWHRKNRNVNVLSVSIYQDEEDAKNPFSVYVFYELLL